MAQPSRASRVLGPIALLVATVLLAGAGGAAWVAFRELEVWFDGMDTASLSRAQQAFAGVLERERDRGLSEARLLADDARIRGTVLVPRFDPTTVRDVLADLRSASRSDLFAVLDRRGRVRAAAGMDRLEEVDLSATEAVRAAAEQAAADVWTFEGRLFVIAVAPVRAGDQLEAFLLIGEEILAAQLAEIEAREGVRGALLVGDRVIVRGREDASLDGAIGQLRADATGPTRFVAPAGPFVAQAHATGRSAAAARAVWAIPRRDAWSRAPRLSLAAYAPAVAVGFMWLVVLALVLLRRSETQGGPK